jgi:SAM-dependent methyltransferase
MWKRPVRSAVHLGLDQPRLRAFVEADLKRRRPIPGVESGAVGREFVDRHRVRYLLDATLRDRLKPGWRMMVDPVAAAEPPTDQGLRDRATKAVKTVAEAATLVATAAGKPLEGRILEVGCYDGASAYQLARRTGTSVVASDLARYYVVQRPGATVDPDLRPQQELLARIRERAAIAAGVTPGVVDFVEDDITRSNLEPASFDAIVSFEMLEHVQQPAAAFAEMARLLRPGGIVYHDYNPFFSSKGGHSLCTLAFPWGHVRLDEADFERYLRELRPTELDQALRFYRESLNRMTLADLRAVVAAAGLELLALVPWFERGLVPSLDPSVLPDIQRLYPTAVIDDLLATFVAVVARRPDSSTRPSRSMS